MKKTFLGIFMLAAMLVTASAQFGQPQLLFSSANLTGGVFTNGSSSASMTNIIDCTRATDVFFQLTTQNNAATGDTNVTITLTASIDKSNWAPHKTLTWSSTNSPSYSTNISIGSLPYLRVIITSGSVVGGAGTLTNTSLYVFKKKIVP
jgi:hypothetical protein